MIARSAFNAVKQRAAKLLMMSPWDIVLRCEEWVASPNRSIHCFEVMPDVIREVAAYAR